MLQDDFPLASLPLLGYIVGLPSPSDGVHKDCVFKLQFKNHVYFFRAESDITFNRYVVFVIFTFLYQVFWFGEWLGEKCMSFEVEGVKPRGGQRELGVRS